MSKLLINEPPLIILPTLAVKIGLNESIFLQQLHYWLDPRINKNFKENTYWVYNTYSEWCKQFPFWSERTLRRIISSLEEKNIIISENFNKDAFDKTKWYSINYHALQTIENLSDRSGQNGQMNGPDSPDPMDKMTKSNIDTKNTTKNTTKNSLSFVNTYINNDVRPSFFEKEREMINIWNKIVKENNNPSQPTETRLKILNQRLKESFKENLKEWEKFCLKITTSKFLMGKVTNFKISLDFAIKHENIQKILEGEFGVEIDKIPNQTNDQINECKHPLWLKVKEILKERLGEATFKSWLSKISLNNYQDEELYFTVPTNFFKQWIEDHYTNEIIESFKKIKVGVKKLNISIAN